MVVEVHFINVFVNVEVEVHKVDKRQVYWGVRGNPNYFLITSHNSVDIATFAYSD